MISESIILKVVQVIEDESKKSIEDLKFCFLDDIDYSKYPDSTNAYDVLSYYASLENQLLKRTSRYQLKICSKKEKLLIIGDNGDKLEEILPIFPLANYDIIGWITSKMYYSKKDYDLRGLFEKADRFLCAFNEENDPLSEICNEDQFVERKITYESVNSFGKNYKFHFGPSNPEKVFFVIRPRLKNGLIWNAKKILKFPELLQRDNEFAAVDMQNYPNQHVAPRYLGKYNAWDYYFNQISDFDLDEIYRSKNVIIVPCERIPDSRAIDREDISDHLRACEEKEYQKIFKNRKNVLGVFLRGTDFVYANWHPIPYDPYETIEVCKQYMSAYHLDYVFLNTEDEHNFNVFREFFKDKLLFLERQRFTCSNLPQESGKLDYFEGLDAGKNYLLESLLTSKTYGVISGPGASGSVIKAFGKKSNHFFDTILLKNARLSSGTNPIVIRSHNKNRLCINNLDCHQEGFDVIARDGILEVTIGSKGKYVIDTFLPVKLNASTTYCLSRRDFQIKCDYTIMLELFDELKNRVAVVKEGRFNVPYAISYAKIIIQSNCVEELQIQAGLQLEQSMFATSFEPYRFSETHFAPRDTDGITYKFECVKSIDLEKGVFFVNDDKKDMDRVELLQANNVIKYEGGYIDIVHGDKTNLDLKQLNTAFVTSQTVDTSFLDIPYEYVKARPFLLQHLTNYVNSNNKELNYLAYRKCLELPKIYDVCYLLFRIYNEGRGVHKDCEKSLKWIEKCINLKDDLKATYADLLLGLNKPEYYEKLLAFLEINLNDDGLRIRLARLYQHGQGVEKNLSKACEIVRPIVDHSGWAKLVYFDIINEDRSLVAASDFSRIVEEMTHSDNVKELWRLIPLYKNDNDMFYNEDLAVSLLEKISILDRSLDSQYKVFDTLWTINTENANNAMLKIIEPLHNCGRKGATWRLSHMYRTGRGVDHNLDMCSQLLRIASDGISSASYEYSIFSKKQSYSGSYVIYSTDHYAALSFMIYIRCLIHPDKKSILIANTNKYPEVYEKLKDGKIFDYVIPTIDNSIHIMRGKDAILHALDQHYSGHLKSIGVGKEDIFTIYSNGDLYNPFGIFLKNKSVPYHFVEVTKDQSKREWYSLSYQKKWVSKDFYELQKDNRVLTSDNDSLDSLIIARSCANQFAIYDYYDFNKMAKKLDSSIVKEILVAFDMNKIKSSSINLILFNSTSLLLQDSSLAVEELPFVYQIIIDMFFPHEVVIIKPHPTTTPELASPDNYRGSLVLPSKFPMELFRLTCEKIDVAIGLKTSSIENNRDIISNEISLGFDFFDYMDYLFLIRVIDDIASETGCKHIVQSLCGNVGSIRHFFSDDVRIGYYNDSNILFRLSYDDGQIDFGIFESDFQLRVCYKETKNVLRKYKDQVLGIHPQTKKITDIMNLRYRANYDCTGYRITATIKKVK